MTLKLSERFRERLPWYFVVAALLLLGVLIGASAANYTSVAQVHVQTGFFPSYSVVYPSPPGPVAFTLHLGVDNPSSRVLLFDTIGYKAWIEDLPAEAGVAGAARVSEDVPGPNGTLYYPVFSGSIQVPSSPVPAGENVTYLYTLNLTESSNPIVYGVVANITAFAALHLGSPSAVPWIFWTLVNLDIQGVPPPASLSPADYLINLGRISLEGGQDLGGGQSLGP